MLIGYARVSSPKADRQDLQTQIKMLSEAGCDEILTERGSGAKRDRPVMNQVVESALQEVQEGRTATILVVRLDRWGRSLSDLLSTLERLHHAGVGFRSLTETIDSVPGSLVIERVMLFSPTVS